MKKWSSLAALGGFALIAFLTTYFLFNQYYSILTPKKLQHYWEITSPYLLGLAGVILVIILLSFVWSKIESRIRTSAMVSVFSKNRMPIAIVCWVFVLGMWFYLLNLNTDLFLKILVFFAVFFLTLCVSYLAFRIQLPNISPALSFLSAILVSGFLLVVGIFGDKVSAYPYSYDWSEGNRLLQRCPVCELA